MVSVLKPQNSTQVLHFVNFKTVNEYIRFWLHKTMGFGLNSNRLYKPKIDLAFLILFYREQLSQDNPPSMKKTGMLVACSYFSNEAHFTEKL